MIGLFKKWNCSHQWETHSKKELVLTTYVKNRIGDGYNKTDITERVTKEILICNKCGKIKKIEY